MFTNLLINNENGFFLLKSDVYVFVILLNNLLINNQREKYKIFKISMHTYALLNKQTYI